MSKPYVATHVVHVTDTTDRNARLKIRSAYVNHLGRIGLRDHTVDVEPALNTLDIGIVASELVNNTERPERLILAVNCAGPDKEEGTTDNVRNDFFCAKLAGETYICGTSNGYEFSYVKGEIEALYRLTNTNCKKSQFRSLEVLPEHSLLFSDPERCATLIADGILKRIENVDDIVPSVPNTTHVFEVDNFWNVKLFPSRADLGLLRQHEGNEVLFSFGRASVEVADHLRDENEHPKTNAVVAPTLFAAPLGTNVIALRSSSRFSSSLSDDTHVPIIATIRKRPGETPPNYDMPVVGARVRLAARVSHLAAA